MREQQQLFSADDLGGNLASVPFLMDSSTKASIHNILTGAPVGTLKLQVCNALTDNAAEIPSTEWMDYAGSEIAISGAVHEMYELTDITIKWWRLVYTRTSGTGAISSNRFSTVGVL
jgi:hypothetical protein